MGYYTLWIRSGISTGIKSKSGRNNHICQSCLSIQDISRIIQREDNKSAGQSDGHQGVSANNHPPVFPKGMRNMIIPIMQITAPEAVLGIHVVFSDVDTHSSELSYINIIDDNTYQDQSRMKLKTISACCLHLMLIKL